LNRQVTTDNVDGSTSLTVDALVLVYPDDGPISDIITGEVVFASVTCSTLQIDDERPKIDLSIERAPTAVTPQVVFTSNRRPGGRRRLRRTGQVARGASVQPSPSTTW
jgi:hypothetical protein